MIDKETLDAVDDGVWRLVRMLNNLGFETTDSGDGRSKPEEARTFGTMPHVVCRVRPTELVYEAMRLQQVLLESADGQWHVEASFSTADHTAILLATQP